MSVIEIAEKKQQLKQDFDAVYEAGKLAAPGISEAYEAGKASMVDESKIIEKTVSGSVISVNDVSEIPHEVKCSISGVDNPESVRVVVVGKNLCDNIWEKNGIHDSTGEIYNTSAAIHTPNYIPIKPYGSYVVSKVNFTESIQYRFYDENKAYIGNIEAAVGTDVLSDSFSANSNAYYVRFNIAGNNIKLNGQLIQLEENKVATEYEPYNAKTYTPNADGNVKGISSISPYMCLFADTVGANIELTYRQSWGVWYGRKQIWDQIQWGGARTDYKTKSGVFSGYQWSFDNFYPTHDIRPTGDANHLFYAWGANIHGNHSGSLKRRLEECGVVLDTSQATSLKQAFSNSTIKELPTIDFTGIVNSGTTSSTTYTNLVFADTSTGLITIEKIIVKEDLIYTTWFRNTSTVENLTVEGDIGNTFDISACKNLTAESAKSIITHLKNYAGSDKELANSVLFHANVWSKLNAEGNASPNGNTWVEYVAEIGWQT